MTAKASLSKKGSTYLETVVALIDQIKTLEKISDVVDESYRGMYQSIARSGESIPEFKAIAAIRRFLEQKLAGKLARMAASGFKPNSVNVKALRAVLIVSEDQRHEGFVFVQSKSKTVARYDTPVFFIADEEPQYKAGCHWDEIPKHSKVSPVKEIGFHDTTALT